MFFPVLNLLSRFWIPGHRLCNLPRNCKVLASTQTPLFKQSGCSSGCNLSPKAWPRPISRFDRRIRDGLLGRVIHGKCSISIFQEAFPCSALRRIGRFKPTAFLYFIGEFNSRKFGPELNYKRQTGKASAAKFSANFPRLKIRRAEQSANLEIYSVQVMTTSLTVVAEIDNKLTKFHCYPDSYSN